MGGYLALDCFCRNWKGATSLRREGQTGLISLQRPLKFLPWDINEVIHRKAAARHTTRPPPPPHSSSHLNNPLQPPFPWPPCCSATLPRKGSAVPGKKPIQLPLRAWQLPIDGPGAGGGWAEGWGVQLCVCRHARRGWQQPGFVSYINRKIMFPQEWAQWFEEWLSCLHIWAISAFLWCVWASLSWVTTGVKLIRVFTGGSTQKLPSQAACFPVISSMYTQSMQKMSQRLMCLSHICENTGWRHCKYHREISRQTQGKIKICLPCYDSHNMLPQIQRRQTFWDRE